MAYLLENGVPPSSILLLTFTNKAAREMLDRVANLLPNDITGLWGGTFHSVGNRILRRHAEAAGFAPGFSIMDREDQQDMLDAVIATLGLDPKDKRFPKGEVLADVFSFSINTGRSIDQVLVEKYPHFLEFSEIIAKGAGEVRSAEEVGQFAGLRRPAGEDADAAEDQCGDRGALSAAVSVRARG